MKVFQKIFLLLCLFPVSFFAQTGAFKLEKANSLFPNAKVINQDKIEWRYLTVPENWNKPDGKTIKIAVAILKSNTANASPVLFLEGGPGAGGINSIWNWLRHPLRENSDIILVDVRGTGNSLPKLCPDLGKKFLQILSENNSSTDDEQQKAIAAAACRQNLIDNKIDIHAYNSHAIAKDLNALKIGLGFSNWSVYGVSYGTHMARVYANNFPGDIKSLILDSPISDISNYYDYNATNYMNSMKRLFEACKNNPVSNRQYPDLENIYYETIDKLEKHPITVKVDKKIIPGGRFTYNAEDFKIAVQQSLYNKDLIEILPLLITTFNKGNESTLSTLVSAFSGAFRLDYGMYYCVTCDEVIPLNSIAEFERDANQYEKLKGGLSFYKSDFTVCNNWNTDQNKTIDTTVQWNGLSTLQVPVLVLSGSFDPITPASNGKMTVDQFKSGFLVNAPVYGHAPGYSSIGREIIAEFIKNPHQQPDKSDFQANSEVQFITDVKINGGIASFANSLGEFNYMFFAPLLIALIILLVSVFSFIYLFIKNKKASVPNKIMGFLIVLTSLLGLITFIGFITSINNIVQRNFFILAFGLPDKFSYLFILQWMFLVCAMISILYFAIRIKKILNSSVVFSILFSLILVGVYFQYWGLLF